MMRAGRLCTTASSSARHRTGRVRSARLIGAAITSGTGAIICSNMCCTAGTMNSVLS